MNTTIIQHIKKNFIKEFNKKPLLFFAPGRINLIGEHTDYNNGFVFPAAINKGIYLAIERTENSYSTAIALDLNCKLEFTLNQLKPIEKGGWKNYILGVISEIQKYGKTVGNFNLVFGGDIPNGSGLSSSAAIENSFVFGLNELFQLKLTKHEMIVISQKTEHNFVGVQCGIMDQYASMFGEKDTAILLDCNDLKATNFKINFKEYDILLINTNVKHNLSESAYNERRFVCEKMASLLNKKTLREVTLGDLETVKKIISKDAYDKALYVIQENSRVISASKAILNEDLNALGKLLYESHSGLQHKYQVSCNELDFLIDETKENTDILGARMMGGGFGGCTINIIKKDAIPDFSKTIQEKFTAKFNTDCTIYNVELSKGTHQIK